MSKQIGILTTNFYSPDGLRMVYGGAERYGLELTGLLIDLGYEVTWWQIGTGWKREFFHGVKINTIPEIKSEFMTFPSLNQRFHEQAMGIDYVIYFVTFLAYPHSLERSISISHGVFWDYPGFDSKFRTETERMEWLRRYHIALGGPAKVVSVDTNTINWVNATWPGLSHRMEYIPNFVDINSVKPRSKKGDKVKVIFPRRLTSVRGLNEAAYTAKMLTAKYPGEIEFHFVGRGHTDILEAEASKWASENEDIYYYWQPPHIMYKVYAEMDIALLPTKAAEGTSLSCLEAMASGCAVITTHIGGLANMIIHDYNGLLIKPTPDSLLEATEYLFKNENERHRLGENAKEVARAFDIKHWKHKWEKIINRVFK
ncbi:MAG: glycosyltransferase family 4 protein [Firmicutes bacterium]|nr:glycosyltransferase family 4 protein [Bacillota bacterium]